MSDDQKRDCWIPIESDPELLNQYLVRLGAESDLSFCDVLGFDDELLAMVPQPVEAAVLLFPLNEAQEAHRVAEAASIPDKVDGVYFTQQLTPNACGTIGLVHVVANTRSKFRLRPGMFMANFLGQSDDMSPSARAEALNKSAELEQAHAVVAAQGQSLVREVENVNLHFVAFVNVGGTLYELDGRKKGPVAHGPTSPATFLQDVVAVTRKFMERAGADLNFNLVALG